MKILIVLPAYNEELVLEKNIRQVLDFCRDHFSNNEFKIVIVDNNSKDKTAEIGKRLAQRFIEVDYLFIDQKGKGVAIKAAWQKYSADTYCFMDTDLATDLSVLPELIEGVREGNDIVIGSRYHKESKVSRSWLRKLISRGYRLLAKILLKLKVNDLPCGFKAINNKIKEKVLPQVIDQGWFFDSELIILAEKQDYKIKEIPVSWSEYRDLERRSTVDVFKIAAGYLQKIWRMRKRI